jgi:hypothetical protein
VGVAVTSREALRQLAESLPAGTAVPVPREWLLDLLDGTTAPSNDVEPTGDLTVSDIAARFGRTTTTVRGWLARGLFPGAYLLRGRSWRVPAGAVEAFVRQEQQPTDKPASTPVVSLSAWRKVRR